MLWELAAAIIELADVAFVFAFFFGDSLDQGVIKGSLVDDVPSGAAEVHGRIAGLVRCGILLELDRLLVLAPEALEAPVAAPADAVGARSFSRQRRSTAWNLRWLWQLGLVEDLLNLLVLLLICWIGVDGFLLHLLFVSQYVLLYFPDRLDRRRLLWPDVDSGLSGSKKAGTSLGSSIL